MIKFDKTKKIHEQITPESWTQRLYYRSQHGGACDRDNAVCACSVGWLWLKHPNNRYAYVEDRTSAYQEDLNRLTKVLGPVSITTYNDSHSFEDVLAVFKAADV